MSDISEMKRVLRKQIATTLKGLGDDLILEKSKQIADHVFAIQQVKDAGAISVYLSMKKEVQTDPILPQLFKLGKRVFVPKVVGGASNDMKMPELASMEELLGLEKSKWGIPEFSIEQLKERADGIDEGVIDLVLAPGVAFTKDGWRLGHGKGYYDCFLTKLTKIRADKGLPPPFVVGLALDEQIQESVPTSDHDVPLNMIVTPSEVYTK